MAILPDPEDLRPYECRGLSAYRALPLAVCLPILGVSWHRIDGTLNLVESSNVWNGTEEKSGDLLVGVRRGWRN